MAAFEDGLESVLDFVKSPLTGKQIEVTTSFRSGDDRAIAFASGSNIGLTERGVEWTKEAPKDWQESVRRGEQLDEQFLAHATQRLSVIDLAWPDHDLRVGL